MIGLRLGGASFRQEKGRDEAPIFLSGLVWLLANFPPNVKKDVNTPKKKGRGGRRKGLADGGPRVRGGGGRRRRIGNARRSVIWRGG